MKYIVPAFFIDNVDSKQYYVMNTENTLIVNEPKMLKLLLNIDSNNIHEIDEEFARKYLKEDTLEGLEFLQKQKLIYPSKQRRISYKQIYLCTNDKIIYDDMKFNFDSLLMHNNTHLILFDDVDKINFLKSQELDESFCLFILNPFSIKLLENITKLVQLNKCYTKISFFYNSKFYITNLYQVKVSSPCPLCFFYNLESSIRAENSEGVSFQTIVDIVYNKNTKFQTLGHFSTQQLLPLITLIMKKAFNTDEYSYKEVFELDYSNNLIQTDIAYFWDLCDCYEK